MSIESEVVARLLTVWHAERDAWHAEHGDAPTAKSHCVAVASALAILLNREGIHADVVWYEVTALLVHDDHESARIVELTPRHNGGVLYTPGSSSNSRDVNAHVAVETEWGFHDPTFDQFGESQYDNWSVDLLPWSVEWRSVALRHEVKRPYPEVKTRWDFALADQYDSIDVRVFYRELKRQMTASPLVARLVTLYDQHLVTFS